MIRGSSTEFDKDGERFQDAALSQPKIATGDGDENQRLKKRARDVLLIDDFTDAYIEAVLGTAPSTEAETFNQEVNF